MNESNLFQTQINQDSLDCTRLNEMRILKQRNSILKLLPRTSKLLLINLHSSLPLNKTRKRRFDLDIYKLMKPQSKYSGNVYSLGIVKYDTSMFKDQRTQYMIISD